MVSEEYAAAHPNGVLEFASAKFDSQEGAADFNVIVARRGGTKGKLTIDFKVIDVTAEYGKDYTVLVPSLLGNKALVEKTEVPTLLEASLQEHKDDVITVAGTQSSTPEAATIYTTGGNNNSRCNYIGSIHYCGCSDGRNYGICGTASDEASGQTGTAASPTSSLQKMRDEVFGEASVNNVQKTSTTDSLFAIQDEEQSKVADAVNTLIPGVTSSLTFEDGENYKTFKVHLIDDSLYEAPNSSSWDFTIYRRS